jgi:hypothetical protein
VILYELAKKFEERARISETLRGTDDETGRIPVLREEMALLEQRLYEQARQWLNGVQLSALLPAAIPKTLAMLPDVPIRMMTVDSDERLTYLPDVQLDHDLADEDDLDDEVLLMPYFTDTGAGSSPDIVL